MIRGMVPWAARTTMDAHLYACRESTTLTACLAITMRNRAVLMPPAHRNLVDLTYWKDP